MTLAVAGSDDTSPGDRSQYVTNWAKVERSLKDSIWAKTLKCSTDDPGTDAEGCSLPTTGEKRPWDVAAAADADADF